MVEDKGVGEADQERHSLIQPLDKAQCLHLGLAFIEDVIPCYLRRQLHNVRDAGCGDSRRDDAVQAT